MSGRCPDDGYPPTYTPAAPNSSSTRSGRSGNLRIRTPVAS